MTASLKLLAVAIPIVGGGVAIPLYLKSSDEGSTGAGQNLLQASSSKEECEFSEIPNTNPDLVSFLKEKSLTSENYSYVSCSGHKLGLFSERWMGLFPKEDLEKTFSIKDEVKFSVNVLIEKIGDRWNDVYIVFKNPKTESLIKGKWEGFSREKIEKESLLLRMNKDDRKKRDIYILTDKVDANKI